MKAQKVVGAPNFLYERRVFSPAVFLRLFTKGVP